MGAAANLRKTAINPETRFSMDDNGTKIKTKVQAVCTDGTIAGRRKLLEEAGYVKVSLQNPPEGENGVRVSESFETRGKTVAKEFYGVSQTNQTEQRSTVATK